MSRPLPSRPALYPSQSSPALCLQLLQKPLRHNHHISPYSCIPTNSTSKSSHQLRTIPHYCITSLYETKTKMSKSPQHQDIYNQLAAKDTNPEPLKKVLAREQADYDCLSCRVMGVYLLLLQYFHAPKQSLIETYRGNGLRHSRRIHLLVWSP